MKSRSVFHHYTHIAGLVIMGMSLPLSKYLVSVSVFLLIANWISAGNLRNKWMTGHQRKSLLFILSVLLIYCLGMIYTENFQDGLKRILSLMPLMAMAVILGTVRPISRYELKFVLLAFVFGVSISSVISIGHYYGWFNRSIKDIRDISAFIPHLYLSLMVNMSIMILMYMVFYEGFMVSKPERLLYLLLSAGLIFFIFFLKSFLGIIIFIIVFPVFLFILMNRIHFRFLRIFIFSFSVIILISALATVMFSVAQFYDINKEELSKLETHTINGNPYSHQPDQRDIENGQYVWINVCDKELEKEWNALSHYPYDSLDMKGQNIRSTLIRYMASKGLRKDSAGVHQLSINDRKLIENGYANHIYSNKYGIYQRIYQVIWEIDRYFRTGDVQSHSVAQRIVFSKFTLKLIRENRWFGVGTGDIKSCMVDLSHAENVPFQKEWEGKPHNQFLNFAATFGWTGCCWILFALGYPIFRERKQNLLLLRMFLAIFLISMMGIDTFDSHIGITFFAFFYGIFIYFWQDKVV